MDSFYGGHQGTSFVIKARFPSVEAMEEAFKQGPRYRDVWFGEYCIIDTPNKNDPDNGKIFRRGAEYAKISQTPDAALLGDPIEIGQIVGPSSGIPFVALTTIDDISDDQNGNHGYGKPNRELEGQIIVGYDADTGQPIYITDEQRLYPSDNEYYYDKSNDGNDPDLQILEMIPPRDAQGKLDPSVTEGQLVSGENVDSIKWTWCNVRTNSDSESYPYNYTRLYVGFQVPYHYFSTSGQSVSPYGSDHKYREVQQDVDHSYNLLNGKENPFSHHLNFNIQAGIPGISYTDFSIVTFDSSCVEIDDFGLYRPENLIFTSNAATPFVELADGSAPIVPEVGHRALVACLRCFDEVDNPTPRYKIDTINVAADVSAVPTSYLSFRVNSDYSANENPEISPDTGHVRSVWVYLGEYDQPKAGTKILKDPNNPATVNEYLSSLTSDGTLILYKNLENFVEELGSWWEDGYTSETIFKKLTSEADSG